MAATREQCEAYLRKLKKGEFATTVTDAGYKMTQPALYFQLSRKLVKEGWTMPEKESKKKGKSPAPKAAKKVEKGRNKTPVVAMKKAAAAKRKSVEKKVEEKVEEEPVEERDELEIEDERRKLQLKVAAGGCIALLLALSFTFFSEEIFGTLNQWIATPFSNYIGTPFYNRVFTPVYNFIASVGSPIYQGAIEPFFAAIAHAYGVVNAYVTAGYTNCCSAVCSAYAATCAFFAHYYAVAYKFVSGLFAGKAAVVEKVVKPAAKVAEKVVKKAAAKAAGVN